MLMVAIELHKGVCEARRGGRRDREQRHLDAVISARMWGGAVALICIWSDDKPSTCSLLSSPLVLPPENATAGYLPSLYAALYKQGLVIIRSSRPHQSHRDGWVAMRSGIINFGVTS